MTEHDAIRAAIKTAAAKLSAAGYHGRFTLRQVGRAQYAVTVRGAHNVFADRLQDETSDVLHAVARDLQAAGFAAYSDGAVVMVKAAAKAA